MRGGITRRHIPEIAVLGMPLGRHYYYDVRNADYPADRAAALKSVLHKSWGLPLDQAEVGSCTGEATVGVLNSQPHCQEGQALLTQKDAYRVYGLETNMEGSPWPPNDPGGSGTEVCMAAKHLGWLSAYQHAFGIEHALQALAARPVMTGVDWFSSFDTPDPETGVITIAPGATIRGGHEFAVVELRMEDELVGCEQSWGTGWGLTGRFYLSFKDWDQLLQTGGDVTVPRTAHGWHA
jgi:hypothetical protein